MPLKHATKWILSPKIVKHGAVTTRRRPKGPKIVVWVGSATPTYAKTGVDVRYNPATGAYTAL